MPILECPECGDEFSYSGKRTTAYCPKEECEGEVPVGGPNDGRDHVGFDRADLEDAVDRRHRREDRPARRG